MDSEAFSASIFLTMLLAVIIIGHFIHKRKFKYVTEGSIALLLGLFAGGFFWVYYVYGPGRHQPLPMSLATFNNNVFFHVLLPPIIFYAGFSVKKKLFFRNFSTIAMFGIVGTFFYTAFCAFATYGLFKSMLGMSSNQALHFSLAVGAIFSCSDTVSTLQVLDQESQPVLYSLVFGEGVVNDATAIVLLGAVQKLAEKEARLAPQLVSVLLNFVYLFIASLALGVGFGLLSSLVIRHGFRQHASDREVLTVGLMGLLAYTLAETLNLSAILSVFFCGITMSHYTYYNLTPAAQSIAHHSFRIIAAAMELTLFLFAGLDMWLTALWHTPDHSPRELTGKIATLSVTLLAAIIAARAMFVFLTTAAANRLWRRRDPITYADCVTIWWAGLARGAITLALVYHQFYHTASGDVKKQVIIAAAIIVVLVTTVLMGSITAPFLETVRALLPPPPASSIQPAYSTGLTTRGGDSSLEVPLLNGVPIPPLNGSGFNISPAPSLHNAAAPLVAAPTIAAAVPLLTALIPPVNERRFLHRLWHNFDHAVMQPVFGGSSQAQQHPRRPAPQGPLMQGPFGAGYTAARGGWALGSKRSVAGSFAPALLPDGDEEDEEGEDDGYTTADQQSLEDALFDQSWAEATRSGFSTASGGFRGVGSSLSGV